MSRTHRLIRISAVTLLTIVVAASSPRAQAPTEQKPSAPPAAQASAPADSVAPAPIPMDQADIQAITQAMADRVGLMRAIAALQKELDATNAEGQRASIRAQAKHPDMPISTQTWTYTPVPKKDGGH